MSAPSFRTAQPGDRAALYRIWQACFGDEREDIDAFFAAMYRPELTAVAELYGRVAAAAYGMPVGEIVLPEGRLPCGYIYAVGTLPEFRDRGLGARVTLKAAELCRGAGLISGLVPAESDLFDYYQARCGYKTSFYATEFTISATPRTVLAVVPVAAEEYGRLREARLAGTVHVAFDARALAYAGTLLSFYRVGEDGCAAAELRDGFLTAKELLPPADAGAAEAGRALMWALGAHRCVLRTPGPGRAFAMSDTQLPFGYWGFAFD